MVLWDWTKDAFKFSRREVLISLRGLQCDKLLLNKVHATNQHTEVAWQVRKVCYIPLKRFLVCFSSMRTWCFVKGDIKSESCSFTLWWLQGNIAIHTSNNLFANWKSKADTVWIQIGIALKCAKVCEDFSLFFFRNSDARIRDWNVKSTHPVRVSFLVYSIIISDHWHMLEFGFFEPCLDWDGAFLSKLDRIRQ